MEITPIAVIRTEFLEKFGVPRQSGLASSLRGRIVFNKEYRDSSALKGLEGFSHLWLLWEFSANRPLSSWHPEVRPPRLGGNAYMGVFATRSPFRPNPIGLSCVEIDHIETDTPDGPVIYVCGADMMDGTPIYDIKPYIKYADSYPDAVCGYVDHLSERTLKVVIPVELSEVLGAHADAVAQVLSLDPRPSYQDDPKRVYGMSFAGYNVRFVVDADVLTVIEVSVI